MVCAKIYEESNDHFSYLIEIRDLMLKAFIINQEHQAYIDLLEVKGKAEEAIKIKNYTFPIQLKVYDYQLSAFMKSLDDTMFNDWISDWGERLTMSDFDDEKWTIIKGYFWIHLKDRLENKIKEDKRLKEQEEDKKRRQKQLKEAYKQVEENRKREEKLGKQKEAELAKKIKEEKENKAKEEKQKRIDEENQNFENNIIKKIKENWSNIVFCKNFCSYKIKQFYFYFISLV